jgi:large conductance mechanosensitive channel
VKGFLHFIRTQGVIGLAVGFVLGGASQQLVSSLSSDIITPLIGLISGGAAGNLATASSTIGGQTFGWGHFIFEIINLVLIALVVYLVVTLLHAEKLDEKKA